MWISGIKYRGWLLLRFLLLLPIKVYGLLAKDMNLEIVPFVQYLEEEESDESEVVLITKCY